MENNPGGMTGNRFVWTEDYAVGILFIDDQHKRFFDIANKTLDLVEKDAISGENLNESLNELSDYANYHLKTEEEYFDKYGYAEKDLHIGEHNRYRETIKGFLEKAKNEGLDIKNLAKEAASYSGEWLSKHILIVDKKYTRFFNEKGLF